MALPPDPHWRPVLKSRLYVAAGVLVLWALAIETRPVSTGWRRASKVARWNSGSSSRKSTPLCARLISPGLARSPPPTIAGSEAE